MAEPDSITPNTPYPASPNKPPQLHYEITQERWEIDIDPGGSGVRSDYLDRPLTPVSALSSTTTSSEHKNPAPQTTTSLLTSDSSSSRYTAPIRAAVTDNRQIINYRNDGSIASATLEGLVERLIKTFSKRPYLSLSNVSTLTGNAGLRKDEEFRDILLSSTVDFVPAEEFFSVIERRFREADRTAFRNPEDRIALQYKCVLFYPLKSAFILNLLLCSILTILSYWVITPHLPLEPPLVWQMRDFCDDAKNKINSQTMRDKAEGIIESLNQDVRR